MSVHVGKAIAAPLEEICEALMIYAQLMKDRCVKIVYGNFVFDCSIADFVSFAKVEAWLKATSCDYLRETIGMVIATIASHLLRLSS